MAQWQNPCLVSRFKSGWGGVHGKYCNPCYTDSWGKRISSSRPAWTTLQYLVSTQNGVGTMSAQWWELAWHTWRVILKLSKQGNSENPTIHQEELSLTINLNILIDMLNNILKNMLAIGTSLFIKFSLRLGLKKTAAFSYLNTICCNLFFDFSIVRKIWPHTIGGFYSPFRLVCYCTRFFLKVRCNEPSTILSINILYSITLNSAVLWIKFGFVNLWQC